LKGDEDELEKWSLMLDNERVCLFPGILLVDAIFSSDCFLVGIAIAAVLLLT
jgi:hypothetical protein